MTRNQQLLCLFAALLAASPELANAARVTETTTSSIVSYAGQSGTFSFPDVANADELVSVSSGGTVNNFEGFSSSTLEIFVDYTSGASTEIASQTYPKQVGSSNFTVSTTSFPIGDIDGLTFKFGNTYGSFNLESGTKFTFDVATPITPPAAPEPSTWVTMVTGFGIVGAALRLRRRGARVRFV